MDATLKSLFSFHVDGVNRSSTDQKRKKGDEGKTAKNKKTPTTTINGSGGRNRTGGGGGEQVAALERVVIRDRRPWYGLSAGCKDHGQKKIFQEEQGASASSSCVYFTFS